MDERIFQRHVAFRQETRSLKDLFATFPRVPRHFVTLPNHYLLTSNLLSTVATFSP